MLKKKIVIQLDPEDYAQLERKANDRALEPVAMAGMLLRQDLSGEPRVSPQKVLGRLKALRERLPPVDVVVLMHQGRADLDV